MRLITAGAHEDVAFAAEQGVRARFVTQEGRIAPEIGPGQFDPFARIGKRGSNTVGSGAGTGFVRAAEEEDRQPLDAGGQAAR